MNARVAFPPTRAPTPTIADPVRLRELERILKFCPDRAECKRAAAEYLIITEPVELEELL